MLAFYFAREPLPRSTSASDPGNYASGNASLLIRWGRNPDNIGAFMTIGQIAEAFVMLLVPPAVAAFGVKRTMLIGAGAWVAAVRPLDDRPPVVAHDRHDRPARVLLRLLLRRRPRCTSTAPPSADIKASAQSLLIFIVYGMGTIFGNLLAGVVKGMFTDGKVVNWAGIWAVPFVLTLLSTLAFAALFRGEEIRKPAGVADPLSA